MASEVNFELAHVLFMDVVDCSKMMSDDQREVLRDLNAVVRGTDQFRAADAQGKLISLPTGMEWRWPSSLRRRRRCGAQSKSRVRSGTAFRCAWEFTLGP